MTERSFKMGRQSEQFYNEELSKIYESIRTLLEPGTPEKEGPDSKLHGSLWLKQETNELFSYDKGAEKWDILFRDKFRITDQMLSELPPSPPIVGQLWINNGMLWYYDGLEWKVVYAHDPDADTPNNYVNEDFLFISPLTPVNNTVVNGNKSQFIVPHINKGRLYRNNKVDTSYTIENDIAIQIDNGNLADHHTWVHTNPDKLVQIKKRVIRIDKDTSYYEVPVFATEIFGYTRRSYLGEFLRPDKNGIKGQYQVHQKGIILAEEVTEKYDYLLVVEYEFAWKEARGHMQHGELTKERMGYFLGRHHNAINLFVDGYDLESTEYYFDNYSKTMQPDNEKISAEKNKDGKYELSFMRSVKNEYGFIRQEGGRIKLRNRFKDPLVIVAGQAMSARGDADLSMLKDGLITVPSARIGMSYSVIELRDDKEKIYIEGMTKKDAVGNAFIEVNNLSEFVRTNEGLILFIDGMLVKKEDIVRDYKTNRITVEHLDSNQEFILIRDRYNDLYHQDNVYPAYQVPRVDESMVFKNGYLLNNDTSVLVYTDEDSYYGMYHNEVRGFYKTNDEGLETIEYKYWNEAAKRWILCTASEVRAINTFCFSYDNGLNSIALRIDRADSDKIDYWVYQTANTVEHPIRIYNSVMADEEIDKLWAKPEIIDGKAYVKIPTVERFPFASNSLQVYADGLRLYDRDDMDEITARSYENEGIIEAEKGDGFYLPFRHYGSLSYIIDRPNDRKEKTCERELLTRKNRTDMPGVYMTEKQLFPGVVTVYINGQRQSREDYIILDNHTILLKNRMHLTGHSPTGTAEEVQVGDDYVVIDFKEEDYILVEVREDYRRIEKKIVHIDKVEDNFERLSNRIEFNCDRDDFSRTILKTKDEILIYTNGLFTGYRRDEGYRRDHQSASIIILAEDFQNAIYFDDIYEMLEKDPVLKRKWIEEYGPIDRETINTFVLEWR